MKPTLFKNCVTPFLSTALLLATSLTSSSGFSGETIKLTINGSTTVNPVVTEAAEMFRKKGWKIYVDTHGGSSGGVTSVSQGNADIGMASRPLTPKDHEKFPNAKLTSFTIGYDGVALVVNKAIYNAGVKALNKTQIKGIYEQTIKNWSQVGGPDTNIRFYNKEPGRGTWEVFAKYLYGKANLAPKVFHPEVGANREALSKVATTKGSMTQLSAAWAYENKDKVMPLAIVDSGKTVEPTSENIRMSLYPLKRPLNLIINGNVTEAQKMFITFLASEEGQKIVEKHGYLTLDKGQAASLAENISNLTKKKML